MNVCVSNNDIRVRRLVKSECRVFRAKFSESSELFRTLSHEWGLDCAFAITLREMVF